MTPDIAPVLVTGATGYIGGRLVPALLEAGHTVRCLARDPAKLDGLPWRADVEVAAGDITDPEAVARALEGTAAAYYLVHSMGSTADFASRDRQAAEVFCDAAAAAGTGRIIYLGGLGDPGDAPGGRLSHHLESRHEVGRALAAGPVPVTELRAAVIIGSGSASFEMLRNLVEVLPAMVTPKWVDTPCQPVAVRDVLHWLVAALGSEAAGGQVLEVGGPDVLTYRKMMHIYAEVAGLRRRLIVPVPLLTPGLSSLWVGLVTPLPTGLARPLVDSLTVPVVVKGRAVGDVLPHQPISFREAVRLAVRRVEGYQVDTSWAGAGLPGRTPADPLPTDPHWAGGTLMSDHQEVPTSAPPEVVYRVISGLGGRRGWYVAEGLWAVRGLADKLVGGVGLRRGRRHPDELRVGDAVDFWRVEAAEAGRLLRLRAEMRLPGRAWLEWRLEPDGAGGTVIHQEALFHPRGLWGRAYWYAVYPFHGLVFAPLARRLAEEAEKLAPTGAAA